MGGCECGCGKATRGGDFLPGLDQELRVEIERRSGGLMGLKNLVETAESYAQGKVPLQFWGIMFARSCTPVRQPRMERG